MRLLVAALLALFKPKAVLIAENLCLRQQLNVVLRNSPRSRFKNADRRFWVLICRWFAGWRGCLVVVTPQTVLAWHRRGWRAHWRLRSRRRPGRPAIQQTTRELIRRFVRENRLWGQQRIRDELAKFGFQISARTVAKYMRRPWNGTPSPRWKDFLKTNAEAIWACDFCCVRTVTFRTLYVFFLIHHGRREIVHIRATTHPTAAWTAHQMTNACFEREPSVYLLRDRDSIFGKLFQRRVRSLGIRQILSPVHSPKANAIAERFVGTLRRECLDHTLIFNERHLQKVVTEFADYYNSHRPHQSLGQPPMATKGDFPATEQRGQIVSIPVLGGLHHVYRRAA